MALSTARLAVVDAFRVSQYAVSLETTKYARLVYRALRRPTSCHVPRAYTTTPPPKKDVLKTELLKLYKRVHPDLFHSSPEQRTANEKSFALLQEYLRLARASQEPHDAPAKAFHIEFYVKNEKHADDSHNESGGSTERVEMMLAPPSRRSRAQLEAGSVAPSALKAIFALLTKCGITPENSSVDQSGDAEDKWWATVRLVDFLPEAAERIRLFSAVAASAARQDGGAHIGLMRQALKVGRGVSVSFRSEPPLSKTEQGELLKTLAEALDLEPDVNLRGCTIRPSTSNSISNEGHILLNICEPAHMWAETLKHVDMDKVAAAKRFLAEVQAGEKELAKRLQVPMVVTPEEWACSPPYSQFLHRMLAEAVQRGPPFPAGQSQSPAADTVPLFVTPPTHSLASKVPPYSLCEERAVILVPMDASGEHLYACLRAHGPAGAALLRRREEEARGIAAARDIAKSCLRLRRLERAEDVTREEFVKCCHRLVEHAQHLKPLAEGMSIKVARTHEVDKDGVFVNIQWDFEL